MRNGETRKPEDNDIYERHPTSTPNNEQKQQQPSCEGSSIERSFSNERSGAESKDGGNGNSMLDIFVDRLTSKIVKRYRLDETKRPENVSNGCGTLECSNQEKDVDDDDLMVASGAEYDSPALTNEMIEYRKYGLEVANQIQNVVRGEGRVDLATTKVVKYIDEHEENILEKLRKVALRYIREEVNGIKGKDSSSVHDAASTVVIDIVRKQKDMWLTLPQPFAAPWGLRKYISLDSNTSEGSGNQTVRGDWVRDNLALLGVRQIRSDTTKAVVRPVVEHLISNKEINSIQETVRKTICNRILPDSQVLVNDAMHDNIMTFLEDAKWREIMKMHTQNYIEQTFILNTRRDY